MARGEGERGGRDVERQGAVAHGERQTVPQRGALPSLVGTGFRVRHDVVAVGVDALAGLHRGELGEIEDVVDRRVIGAEHDPGVGVHRDVAQGMGAGQGGGPDDGQPGDGCGEEQTAHHDLPATGTAHGSGTAIPRLAARPPAVVRRWSAGHGDSAKAARSWAVASTGWPVAA